jgi:hypothetical protein
MDLLHEQIATLNAKVDALQQTVEALGSQTADAFAEMKIHVSGREMLLYNGEPARRPASSYSAGSFDESVGHKDILSDNDYLESDSHTGEHALSSEIQIQRLTAQLTAAYNRIAALEEQLLARRVH